MTRSTNHPKQRVEWLAVTFDEIIESGARPTTHSIACRMADRRPLADAFPVGMCKV